MSLTHGSLFAGIGGFDLGFQQAGFEVSWQVEINPILRAVLADRFNRATQHADVRSCGSHNLASVDCITAGFPCQDLSTMGSLSERQGLCGKRSGLFWEALRIIREVRPRWLVLENVVGLLHCHDGRDMQEVIQALANCGYLGFWRVLNSQYFGVPQNRRRVFILAGLGCYPSFDFLSDAAPVEAVPIAASSFSLARTESAFASNTLTAANVSSRINLGTEVLVAEENGWHSMVKRERMFEVHGVSAGLDDANLVTHYAAGNAVVPAVAKWIAEHIKKSNLK
jgi:DNA (cytosine-5)-methyltransferase 1